MTWGSGLLWFNVWHWIRIRIRNDAFYTDETCLLVTPDCWNPLKHLLQPSLCFVVVLSSPSARLCLVLSAVVLGPHTCDRGPQLSARLLINQYFLLHNRHSWVWTPHAHTRPSVWASATERSWDLGQSAGPGLYNFDNILKINQLMMGVPLNAPHKMIRMFFISWGKALPLGLWSWLGI